MRVVVLFVIATACSATPVSSSLSQRVAQEGSQVLAQSGTGQYQGSEDHISLEYSVMKQITESVSDVNMTAILLDQDKKFDEIIASRAIPHFGFNISCFGAPDCLALNRLDCAATNNTCGTCKEGFFGDFGDANTNCTAIDCSKAPACLELNREACGEGSPNTCGTCLQGFHNKHNLWMPNEPDMEESNTLCMAVRFRPVVFVHGLGDVFNGPGMSMLTNSVKSEFHWIRIFSAEPGGGLFSMAKPFPSMVEDFVKQIQSIPSLKDGFNLVGYSQGGLIARAYVEKYNDPPVYNLISLHGPQSGISMCPGGQLMGTVQRIAALPCEYAMHWALVTPHDYWRGRDFQGVHSKETYLSWNTYLQDINNEGVKFNQTYRDNMLKLNRYVLVKALQDSVVIPNESEWHGYYEWGNFDKILKMEETEEYKEDRIGLKTLNEQGRILKLTTNGPHVRTTREFWIEELNPLFDNGSYQDGSNFDLAKAMKAHATSKHRVH